MGTDLLDVGAEPPIEETLVPIGAPLGHVGLSVGDASSTLYVIVGLVGVGLGAAFLTNVFPTGHLGTFASKPPSCPMPSHISSAM